MRRLLLAGAAFMESLAACEPGTCADNATRVDVREGRGGYVCVPNAAVTAGDARTGPDEPGATSVKMPAPSASASASASTSASAPPPPICTALSAAAAREVAVLPRTGAATPLEGTAPNGDYELAQASLYGGDGGAPSPSTLRARLDVNGAVLLLAVNDEAYSLAYNGGTLVEVCAAQISTTFFPAGAGTTTHADLGWRAPVLSLVLHRPEGDLELLFERS